MMSTPFLTPAARPAAHLAAAYSGATLPSPMAAAHHVLRFDSLFDAGRAYSFPCDATGQVSLDSLSERARDNYFFVRACVGRAFAHPHVQTDGHRAPPHHPPAEGSTMSSHKSGPQISPPARPQDAGAKPRTADASCSEGGPALQGEGNVTAARRYNEATKDFVASGQVDKKAQEAAPKTAQEGDALQSAEAEGKRHAKR